MFRSTALIMAAIIHSTYFRGTLAQRPLTYTISATWLDDPEYRVTVPLDEKRWATLKENSKNIGLCFAGKAEFPWIVDIRLENTAQDLWATGSLIRSDTVFTTCRVIDDLGDFKDTGVPPKVTFAEMYLFEYANRDNPQGHDWLLGGTREVEEATKNERCSSQQAYYDGGILTLARAIMPSPPTINTVQLAINYRDGLLADFDLSQMEQQRRICYIASFGRDYANIKNTLVKDFKVKVRVYWEQIDLCSTRMDRMCPNRYMTKEDCDSFATQPNQEGIEVMCFQSRAKVGTICDHDKGAPLVCDGLVFGTVILGVKEEFCNDVLPMPFWVQKISMFKDYFDSRGYRGRRKYFEEKGTYVESKATRSILISNDVRRFLPLLVTLTILKFTAV